MSAPAAAAPSEAQSSAQLPAPVPAQQLPPPPTPAAAAPQRVHHKKPRLLSTVPLPPTEQWIRSVGTQVRVEDIRLGTVQEGQVREFDPAKGRKRVQELLSCLPKEPVPMTLWPADVHGVFVFLSAAISCACGGFWRGSAF